MILQVVITTVLTQSLGFEVQQQHRRLIAAHYMFIVINAALIINAILDALILCLQVLSLKLPQRRWPQQQRTNRGRQI